MIMINYSTPPGGVRVDSEIAKSEQQLAGAVTALRLTDSCPAGTTARLPIRQPGYRYAWLMPATN